MYYKRVYDFAAVQIAPSLRIRPRKSGLFTGAWRTTQTRPFHATSPSNTPCHDMRLHVRKLNRRIPLYWMVGTRPGAHCRLRGGLFLPVYEPSALLQAACAMICHLTCVSAASICAGSSGSRHRSNMYALPLLNPRGPAIQARLPRQNVPCLQLIIMLWLWHAYAMSWELVT